MKGLVISLLHDICLCIENLIIKDVFFSFAISVVVNVLGFFRETFMKLM